ncbi:hypothetical protein GGI25_001930 [Coemansia spiralis]|uniref:PXA domain-containing protein n=2 Tax=Coemansia TaxID=4863 RepID=A0A9W8GBP7_9FUNG|nr:PXA domain-containing protein [Coemansia spiralis]KAJ1993362.1 hypothetical protein EDC05_002226 [Coemansia umbellata]KAJ2623489.1 hypothetical protein GGI26_002328 [Coemansia sp. RSA 1358]KAJ2678941.1 hypothetical protein GGI25_001930 [Coemansia spiralis]
MSTTRKRVPAAQPRVSQDGVLEPLAASRPSSLASAPSTIAESLRSYWESRRGATRRTQGPLFRNLYRSPTHAKSKLGSDNAKKSFVKSSPLVNASISRLVSLILRDFVQEWYEKITDDKEFLEEVSYQMLQVINELEARCRRVDWVRFILFEFPEIIHLHVRDSQQCMGRLGTVYVGNQTSIEAIFQSMQPHVALTRAADSELAYLRSLSKELLVVLLPPEAQNDEVVHHLLREILACAVLRNVVDAIADPSTLNEAIIRAVGKYSKKDYFRLADMSRYSTQPLGVDDENNISIDAIPDSGSGEERAKAVKTTTVETMLHEAQTTQINNARRSTQPMDQPASPNASTDSQTKHTTIPANGNVSVDPKIVSPTTSQLNNEASVWERLGSQLSFASLWLIRDLFSQARWRGWKNNTIRSMVYLHLIVTQAFSRMFSMFSEYTFSLNQLWQPDTMQASYRGALEPLLSLLNAALLLDRYNQWVWAQFLFYIYPLINILAGAAIDRTLIKVVLFLISEQQLATYVDILISELWKSENDGRFKSKNGQKPYKTLEQQELLRKDAAELVAELLPFVATRLFYGSSEEERLVAAQRILEPFENRQLNKHLVYNVLDSIVGKIAPELKEEES